MRAVESALVALVVVFTIVSVSRYYTPPTACFRCERDANTVAAWLTMISYNYTVLAENSVEANATLRPVEGDYTAPVVVWVNGTPAFYTVGWRP